MRQIVQDQEMSALRNKPRGEQLAEGKVVSERALRFMKAPGTNYISVENKT